MDFLSWIGDLVRLFISFIPHLDLMKANHGGVKFKRGGKVKEIRPGLFWYWPIVTEVQEIPTRRQTMRLEVQTLTTTDNKPASVNCVVVYEINNVLKALVETWDIEDTISDVAQFSVTKAISTRQFSVINRDLTTIIQDEIKERCKKDLRQFGVLVKDAFLSDFAHTVTYRIMGEGAGIIAGGEEDDE